MRLPIPEFKILLYGPGLPQSGVKARAHFEDSVLVIQGKGHWFAVEGDRLSLKMGGYDGRQWLLSWYTNSGPSSAMLQGEDAVQAFIKLAPPAVAKELKRVRFAHGNRARWLRAVMFSLAMVLLVPVLLIGLYWVFGNYITHWAAGRVTQEQKVLLGEMAYEQMRPTMNWVERGDVRTTVEFIGVRVTTGSLYRYVFHVADSAEARAYALPGGNIIVHSGLLKEFRNPEELAAFLAHVASHAELGYVMHKLIDALGWRAIFALILGDFSNTVWSEIAAHSPNIRFDGAMENAADAEALFMLRRAGVSAGGMLPLLQRMAEQPADLTEIWSMYPVSQARIEVLTEQVRMQADYQTRPLPVDWSIFERSISRMHVR